MTFFYLHTLPQFEPEMKNDVKQLQLFSQTLQIYIHWRTYHVLMAVLYDYILL